MSDDAANLASVRSRVRLGPAFLIYFHIIACCLSLIYVAEFYKNLQIVLFDESRLYAAAINIAPFALASILFTFSQFSFGYVLGFYFYTMMLGYLWLVEFSRFNYDHVLATLSGFGSALAFLLPALFITSPIKQRYILSARALENLLSFILVFAATIIAVGALYNFRLVDVSDIYNFYNFRNALEFPVLLGYAMGATSNALLPFAFACFVARGNWWRAATALLLLVLFYPITLSKIALFAPFWLLFLLLLSRYFEARTSIVFSLFLPISAGLILALLVKFDALSFKQIVLFFGFINLRMIAVPSSALDFYNDFFSTHDITYFCQISLWKPFADCPYGDQLAIVMERTYHLGNFNASLFATEGIASVGLILAPFSVLACGLVISLGNRLSSGLPSRFILLSGGILPQTFLNVPLTTTLLTLRRRHSLLALVRNAACDVRARSIAQIETKKDFQSSPGKSLSISSENYAEGEVRLGEVRSRWLSVFRALWIAVGSISNASRGANDPMRCDAAHRICRQRKGSPFSKCSAFREQKSSLLCTNDFPLPGTTCHI